ncbi:hypothetical protein RHMOL_Rhmol09G0126500 [Rhododendron molle]|uniref:Uncharacterized protein n=1 Tax=Rhododendron molle TaxID=49168 RepID=A0ACC0MCV2_RHOML|nr:hypothetical protein RHMOL_Rhmol09G0126500 [Rhododendron molle]
MIMYIFSPSFNPSLAFNPVHLPLQPISHPERKPTGQTFISHPSSTPPSEQPFYLSLSFSLPPSPPPHLTSNPWTVAGNTNGVQAAIGNSGYDPDPRSKTHTFYENKAEILTLKLTHAHLQSNICVRFVCKRSGVEGLGLVLFLLDGAWQASSRRGVMAWVHVDGGGQEVAHHVDKCNSSSATLGEIRAGLLVLEWAFAKDFWRLLFRGFSNLKMLIPLCKQHYGFLLIMYSF